MKHAFAFIPVLALAATAAIAADATSEVSLPALPDAPVLPPAKPASPPNKAAPAKPDQPKAKAPAPRPQPKSTEIDLSSSKVLSAETEDGKPVYVVFQNEEPKTVLLRDNDHGGWIGNPNVKVGLGLVDVGLWDIEGDTEFDSTVAFFAEGTIHIYSGLSLRLSFLSVPDLTLNGPGYDGCIGDVWYEKRQFNNSSGDYTFLQPMLVLALNRDGYFNPYVGIGLTIQRCQIDNVSGINTGWFSYAPVGTTTGSIDADKTYPVAVAGVEINAGRIRLNGEAILTADELKRYVNPLSNYFSTDSSSGSSTYLFGLDFSMDVFLTEHMSAFVEAKLVGSVKVFGAGIGWRF